MFQSMSPFTPQIWISIVHLKFVIQDFPEGGANPEGSLSAYYLANVRKTAWKWKNLDWEGAHP